MTPRLERQIEFRNVLYYAFLVLLGVLFFLYTLFQARFLIEGPEIKLTNVPSTAETSRTVELEGTTANIVSLTLDGREIYTDKTGHFKETVVLENGYTVATLEAHDRFGRTKEIRVPFVYTPALAAT